MGCSKYKWRALGGGLGVIVDIGTRATEESKWKSWR